MKETYPAYQLHNTAQVQFPACSSSSSLFSTRGKPDSTALDYYFTDPAVVDEMNMYSNTGKNMMVTQNFGASSTSGMLPRMSGSQAPEWSQPTPVIPTTTNTFDRRLLNTTTDWAAVPSSTATSSNTQQQRKASKEAIHSGHFMVSNLKEEDDEQDDQIEKIAPDITKNVENEVIRKRSVATNGVNNTVNNSRSGGEGGNQLVVGNCNSSASGSTSTSKISTDELRRRFIEASLTQLFQCMTLAYSAKLTSPKWNNFKGLKIRWAIKIRLNNYIWRAWHMQFVKRKAQQFSPFALELESMHNRPEAVVLEGKYWKRRQSMAAAEYRKVRMFFKSWANNKKSLYTLLPEDLSTDIDMALGLPDDFDMSLLQFEPMLTDDGNNMLFGEDFIQSITSGQHQMIFPNAREIAQQAGIADFIQPGLLELQPSFSDYVDPSMLTDSFHQPSWAVASSTYNAGPATGGGMHASGSSSSMRNADNNAAWQSAPHQQQITGSYLSTQQSNSATFNNNAMLPQHYNASSVEFCQQNFKPMPAYMQQQHPQSSRQGDSVFVRPLQKHAVRSCDNSKLLPSADSAGSTAIYEMPMQVDDPNYFAAQNFRSRSVSGPLHHQQQQQQQQPAHVMQQQQQQPASVYMQPFNAAPSTNRSVTFEPQEQQQLVANNKQQYFVEPAVSDAITINRRQASDVLQQHRLSLPDDNNLSLFVDEDDDGRTLGPQRTKSDITEIAGHIHQQKLYMASTTVPNAGLQSLSAKSASSRTADYSGRKDAVFKPPIPPVPTTPIQHTHGAIYAALLTDNSAALTRGKTSAAQTVPETDAGDSSTRSKPKRRSKTTQQESPVRKTSAPGSNLPVLTTPTASGRPKSGAVKSTSSNAALPSPKLSEAQQKTLPPPAFHTSPPSTVAAASSSSLLNAQTPLSPVASLSLTAISSPTASTCNATMPSAEQLRRTHIKSGFDVLLNLLPVNYKQPQHSSPQNSTSSSSAATAAAAAAAAKVSKAAVLHKSADYIKHLKVERKRMQDEEDELHKRIARLNEEINYYHTQLPATGVPAVSSRQRGEQMRAMFDTYVRQRTIENHKFYAFGLIVRRLMDSYVDCVANVVGTQAGGDGKDADEELNEVVTQWHEQHCTLPQLRPIVRDSLRQLCTSTSIMSSPETFAQSVRDKAISLSGAGSAGGGSFARNNGDTSAHTSSGHSSTVGGGRTH